MSSTPQVSGKAKAGALAATVASFVVTGLMTYVGGHVPALKDLANNALVVAALVAALTGVVTFVAAYIARHLPQGLVQEIEVAYDNSVEVDAPVALERAKVDPNAPAPPK